MAARGAARILRERSDDKTAPNPSITPMDESSRSMAEHIIQAVGDRFERRLTEEISHIDRRLTEEISRIDRRLTEEISGVRVEMHKGFGEVRVEIATARDKATRWAVLLWVGQIGAMGGLLAYLR